MCVRQIIPHNTPSSCHYNSAYGVPDINFELLISRLIRRLLLGKNVCKVRHYLRYTLINSLELEYKCHVVLCYVISLLLSNECTVINLK